MVHQVRSATAARLLAAFFLIFAGVLAGGCSEQGSAEKLQIDSPLLVEPSATSIKVENKAGLALTDLTITVVPYGPLDFSMRVNRFEPSEKRDIPLNQFRSRDGTTFNQRFHKPKAVRINGKDTSGKSYDVEIPWS